jgi:Flp pilus assembly pilin Flp
MQTHFFRSFAALLNDECGAEVIEYALVLGVVIVACITTIGAFGTKVLARWSSVNSSM